MIYCENIVNVTLFFLLSPDFRTTFPPPPHFRQCHCHNCYNFFFPISTMALLQLVCHIFFFFFSLWALHAHFIPGQQELDRGISVFTLLKFNIFSLPPFSSFLSYFLLNFGNGDTDIHFLSSQF